MIHEIVDGDFGIADSNSRKTQLVVITSSARSMHMEKLMFLLK